MKQNSGGMVIIVSPATVFDVDFTDLQRLSSDEAVDVLRELIWAEASALGIGKNLINIPTAICVADGGIDGEVSNVSMTGGQGLLKQGITRYQVKTGRFSLSGEADIKSILLKEESRRKRKLSEEDIQPRVRACFEQHGTLVVVLFGSDAPDRREGATITAFRNFLRKFAPQFAEASIEVWRQNQLIGFLRRYPSLSLWVNRRALGNGYTHKAWGRLGTLNVQYQAGQAQTSAIDALRNGLRASVGEALHIRLCGEPGIGKTRIALEATTTSDLAPLVLYFERATDFLSSSLRTELLRDDNNFSVILVVDECSPTDRNLIWQNLSRVGPRLKLITIYNDSDEVDRSYAYFEPPPLEPDQVASIIGTYGAPEEAAKRWAEYCGGSPRVAHVLGANLANNPQDLLRPGPLENIWERYVVGYDSPNDAHVKTRRRVLLYLSLFRAFGFEKYVAGEGEEIQKLIQSADASVTPAYFKEVVAELRSRKILQGDATLYITPKLLHIWLWSQWWKTYGRGLDPRELFKGLSPPLQQSFADMLVYADASQAAQEIVHTLLGPSGPFYEAEFLKTGRGGRFFLKLAEAAPTAALRCLEDTVGTWTKEELYAFREGRREVIHALEKIAIWRDLFTRAARLLLALAVAENETWANNATGVFAGLFSNGYGRVAPTETPPAERLPVLREAIQSRSDDEQGVALRAFDAALRVSRISRVVGAEHQGLGREARLWQPKNRVEHVEAYRQIWLLLRESLDNLRDAPKAKAAQILMRNGWELLFVPEFSDLVLDTIEDLVVRGLCDSREVLKWTSNVLKYRQEHLSEHVRQRIASLQSSVIGEGFPARLRLYVGTSILERAPGEDGRVALALDALAEQAIHDPSLLQPHLSWLVTREAENGFAFGLALAKRDREFALLPSLLAAARSVGKNTTAFFLGGYMHFVSKKSPELLEATFETLCQEPTLAHLLVELTWRTGINDLSVKRLLKLAQEGTVDPLEFRILAFGKAVSALSAAVFEELLKALISLNSVEAASVALDLYNFYYVYEKDRRDLPESLTFKVLSQPSLFQRSDSKPNSALDFHWAEIAVAFLKRYPQRASVVATLIIDHFWANGAELNAYSSEVQKVLVVTLELDPTAVWQLCTAILEDQDDRRSFYVHQWLRGSLAGLESPAAIKCVPRAAVWEWVDEDPANRSLEIAGLVPHDLTSSDPKDSISRELLIRYGKRRDLRRTLASNFLTEGWAGPASAHYAQKRSQLLKLKDTESSEFVRLFIDEMVEILSSYIERAEVDEERQRY
jgi:hypothetical protein